MSGLEQSAHLMTPPVEAAAKFEADRSQFGSGTIRFEVDFDRDEFERLRAACAHGPEGYTRFIARRLRTRRTRGPKSTTVNPPELGLRLRRGFQC